MTIEFTVAVSLLAGVLGAYCSAVNTNRNKNADMRKDATDLMTVIIKLENIGAGVTEIKNDISSVKSEIRDARDRIIKVEESAKQAHKRLDFIDPHNKRTTE